MRVARVLAGLAVALLGCAGPARADEPARPTPVAPPAAEESLAARWHWPPFAVAGFSMGLPGSGWFLLGEPRKGVASLAAVGLPVFLGLTNVPPIVFADTPSAAPMWLLSTTIAADEVQAYLAYREALVRLRPGQAPVAKGLGLGELLAAPFKPENLLDWRVWAVAAGLEAFHRGLLDGLAPDAPPTLDGPTAFGARSASLYGATISPAAAYGASVGVGGLVAYQAGVGEECFFRGILQDEIEQDTGSPWLALGATSAVFGAFHYGGVNQTAAWKQVLAPTMAGVAFGGLYQATDHDLSKAIAAHAYQDLMEAVLLSLYPARPGNNLLGFTYRF